MFITAVANGNSAERNVAHNGEAKDIVLRMHHESGMVEHYFADDQMQWVSDLTVLQNGDLLFWYVVLQQFLLQSNIVNISVKLVVS